MTEREKYNRTYEDAEIVFQKRPDKQTFYINTKDGIAKINIFRLANAILNDRTFKNRNDFEDYRESEKNFLDFPIHRHGEKDYLAPVMLWYEITFKKNGDEQARISGFILRSEYLPNINLLALLDDESYTWYAVQSLAFYKAVENNGQNIDDGGEIYVSANSEYVGKKSLPVTFVSSFEIKDMYTNYYHFIDESIPLIKNLFGKTIIFDIDDDSVEENNGIGKIHAPYLLNKGFKPYTLPGSRETDFYYTFDPLIKCAASPEDDD